MQNSEHETAMSIVFLDGNEFIAYGHTFSICCVNAAYQRVQQGACTHKELTVDEKACSIIQPKSEQRPA